MMAAVKLNWRTIALITSVVCGVASLPLALAAISTARYHPPAGAEPPKITDWMQAWGSFGGVIAGLLAAGAATALLLHEREQTRQARAELQEERDAAALDDARDVLLLHFHLFLYQDGFTGCRLNIANHGPRGIRRVTAVVRPPIGDVELVSEPLTIIRADDEVLLDLRLVEKVIVAELTGIDPPGRVTESQEVNAVHDAITRATDVTLYFYDSSNRGWRLPKDGEPERWREPFPTPSSDNVSTSLLPRSLPTSPRR
ncbi:hypothetical protein COO58_17565 [Micromonospora sp. WMMA1996]|uniref:hypothetical protein n=1 Tax=Micromonospora sp. WMMA1996 TaxID=2039878 RepID=UPI000BF43F5A|nr:hypothetical protein [Micromonospora sp. WMMA1996]PGH46017.1 hypothetical protein COO58_17565 [Micromonospora sp. WMMA1996]